MENEQTGPSRADLERMEKRKKWRWHCEDVGYERESIDSTLCNITEKEMIQHRDAVIRANPSLAWIVELPLDHQMIRVFVADRIDHGLKNDFTTGVYHDDKNHSTIIHINPDKKIKYEKPQNNLFAPQVSTIIKNSPKNTPVRKSPQ